LFGEVLAVCCRLYTKHINTLEAVKEGAREDGAICGKEGKLHAYFTEVCRNVRAELLCGKWLVVNDE
jgi:hypothetical protein